MRNLESQQELFTANEQLIPVAAVILVKFIQNKSHVLVSERVSSINHFSLTFPSGKVAKSYEETLQEAAIREVKEETNLEIQDVDYLISAMKKPLRIGEFEITYFFAYIDEACLDENIQNLQPDKHNIWEWITLNQLCRQIVKGKHPNIIDTWWVEEITQIEAAVS